MGFGIVKSRVIGMKVYEPRRETDTRETGDLRSIVYTSSVIYDTLIMGGSGGGVCECESVLVIFNHMRGRERTKSVILRLSSRGVTGVFIKITLIYGRLKR